MSNAILSTICNCEAIAELSDADLNSVSAARIFETGSVMKGILRAMRDNGYAIGKDGHLNLPHPQL